jgi:hypothetical protein
VHRSIRVDGARRRHERLPCDLTAENALQGDLRAAPDEHVGFDRFEVQQIYQRVDDGLVLYECDISGHVAARLRCDAAGWCWSLQASSAASPRR